MTGVLIIACGDTMAANGFCATKKVGPLSALQRLAIVLRQAGADAFAAVTSSPPDGIERHLAEVGVPCRCFDAVQPARCPAANEAHAPQQVAGNQRQAPTAPPQRTGNKNPHCGIQLAAAHLRQQCADVFVVRGDTPLFSDATAGALLRSGKLPAVPVYGGLAGWPVLVSADALYAFNKAHIAGAGEHLPATLHQEDSAVSVADRGILLRLDREAAWEALMAEHRYSHFRPVTKLMVARENIFLGPGIYQLLCALRQTGSVRDACGQMDLSYSKGWRMIRNLEYQLGFEVVTRHKGGASGGHSHLSPQGEALLAQYTAYVDACEAAIRPIFERYFGDEEG